MEIGGVDMEAEVKEAYEVMKRIDVLDVSVGVYLSVRCVVSEALLTAHTYRGKRDMGCSRERIQRTCGARREPDHRTAS